MGFLWQNGHRKSFQGTLPQISSPFLIFVLCFTFLQFSPLIFLVFLTFPPTSFTFPHNFSSITLLLIIPSILSVSSWNLQLLGSCLLPPLWSFSSVNDSFSPAFVPPTTHLVPAPESQYCHFMGQPQLHYFIHSPVDIVPHVYTICMYVDSIQHAFNRTCQ